MPELIVAVFVVTYLGMALGRVPGLKIGRTGIALMAVAVLLATGAADVAAVGDAVDMPTLILLFALMILSAQFVHAGFYDWCAARIAGAAASPTALLALTVAVGGGLSAVLANDIVVFALTPLLCEGIRGRGRDPRPFALALAGAANAGSAATLIGNPQNILIGQAGGLDFWRFAAVSAPPALVSMAIVFVAIRWVWRDALTGAMAPVNSAPPPPFDRRQAAKGALAALALVLLFATPYPREIGALAIAALLLASRSVASRDMLNDVDWQLLLLFACLFVVTAAFATTGFAADGIEWMLARGFFPDNLAILTPLTVALSNTIGNVPAVILLNAVWPEAGEGARYGLALLSTLAGNLLIVGSVANLIVAERAASVNVRLGFRDFARAGLPMTAASMAVAVVWLGLTGWMPWR